MNSIIRVLFDKVIGNGNFFLKDEVGNKCNISLKKDIYFQNDEHCVLFEKDTLSSLKVLLQPFPFS